MIQHWKAIELEIINSDNQDDPTSSCEIIPFQTSKPWTCRDYKSIG